MQADSLPSESPGKPMKLPTPIKTEYSLERLMLKLLYFCHLMPNPDAGKEGRQKEKGAAGGELVR